MEPAETELRCEFTAETIADRVTALGACIRAHYGERRPTLLGILKGSALFSADLARAVGEPAELSFVHARSYGDRTVSSGRVQLAGLEAELFAGRPVVICDTILDTGRTLAAVRDAVSKAGASEVTACVLLDKASRREVAVSADWVGFDVQDQFFVGYGLDHGGRYRTLGYVGVVKHHV